MAICVQAHQGIVERLCMRLTFVAQMHLTLPTWITRVNQARIISILILILQSHIQTRKMNENRDISLIAQPILILGWGCACV